MRFLVMGGTGKVGSHAVRHLLSRGHSVRVLSRTPATARVPAGVEVVGGDLGDPESLARALERADGAALIPPLDPDEESFGLNAVHAVAAANLRQFVYLSLYGIEDLPDAVFIRSKRVVERELERLDLPYSIVCPNNYFQNDIPVRPLIAGSGVYAVPLGPVGCHSVDTGDVGEAIGRLLTEEHRPGRRLPVVGSEAISGDLAAAKWGAALGREVAYGAGDLDAWAQQTRTQLPSWLVDNLVIMYRQFAVRGWLASPEDVIECERFLGRPQRRYADFVNEAAGDLA